MTASTATTQAGTAIGAAVGPAGAGSLQRPPDVRLPRRIVDALHHLWDLDAGRYPWLDGEVDPHFFLGDYTALRVRRRLPADLRQAWGGLPVVGTVHVEAERDHADPAAAARRGDRRSPGGLSRSRGGNDTGFCALLGAFQAPTRAASP